MSKDLFFEERQAELALLVEQVERGEAKALPLYAQVKDLKKMYEDVTKQIEPLAMSEAMAYDEKIFGAYGYEFEKRNGGQIFNYKHLSKWQELAAKMKAVEEEAKQAYLAKQKNLMIATDDGEEIELPTVTYRKDSLLAKRVPQHIGT